MLLFLVAKVVAKLENIGRAVDRMDRSPTRVLDSTPQLNRRKEPGGFEKVHPLLRQIGRGEGGHAADVAESPKQIPRNRLIGLRILRPSGERDGEQVGRRRRARAQGAKPFERRVGLRSQGKGLPRLHARQVPFSP